MNNIAGRIKNFGAKIINLFTKKDPNRAADYLAALLLILMFVLTVFSMQDESSTIDEVVHIPAGYSYLTQQDYRLNPEHPPLVKDLAAVPLLFLHPNFPKDSAAWAGSDQWSFGPQFLYNSGNDADRVIFWSRIPMAFVLIFLGWFIYFWTRKLAGAKTALLALALFSFCPLFLANGGLVTTDVAAALGAVLATFFWLEFLKKPSWKNMIVCGLVFGLALLLKFSMLVLIPFFGLITIVYAYLKTNDFKQVSKYIGRAIIAGLIGAVFVVGPVYWFHLAHYPVEKQLADTKYQLSSPGYESLENVCIWMINQPALRPFSYYCSGAMMAMERSAAPSGWITYLSGRISLASYWYYFPLLYLLKAPLAFHILTLVALFGVLWLSRSKDFLKNRQAAKKLILDHFAEFSMMSFVLAYWAVDLKSALNIGIRHLLPVYPFTFVLVSLGIKITVDGIKSARIKKITVCSVLLLLFWYAISSLSVFPYYLTYFNELAGGSKNGYKYAVDSNYDWGQDFKRLAKWVDEQKIDKIYLDYFGTADINYYLKGKYYAWYGSSWWSRYGLQATGKFPAGNYLAVSATHLQQGRGTPVPGLKWQGGEYDWLNNYQPIARIGNSIFVYYIY